MTPIVRKQNAADAIKAGSSDIHFEPYENATASVTVPGVLHEASPPVNWPENCCP